MSKSLCGGQQSQRQSNTRSLKHALLSKPFKYPIGLNTKRLVILLFWLLIVIYGSISMLATCINLISFDRVQPLLFLKIFFDLFTIRLGSE